MLSSKKSDAGSSSSSSSSSAGTAGGDRAPISDAQTGPSASAAGAMDAKKKERSSPSGETGGAPLAHQAGPGGVDQDSAEVRRTSRRKRAKVNILGFCMLRQISPKNKIDLVQFGTCRNHYLFDDLLVLIKGSIYMSSFKFKVQRCSVSQITSSLLQAHLGVNERQKSFLIVFAA